MTAAKPTEPPTSGPAVPQPPHGLDDRPRTTVYERGAHALWIYWPDRWQQADVRSRQDYRDGRVVYQVELYEAADRHSKVLRSFAWGPDNIRAVHDAA